jgi:hypothetical protein
MQGCAGRTRLVQARKLRIKIPHAPKKIGNLSCIGRIKFAELDCQLILLDLERVSPGDWSSGAANMSLVACTAARCASGEGGTGVCLVGLIMDCLSSYGKRPCGVDLIRPLGSM